jgi:hypothetical protein
VRNLEAYDVHPDRKGKATQNHGRPSPCRALLLSVQLPQLFEVSEFHKLQMIALAQSNSIHVRVKNGMGLLSLMNRKASYTKRFAAPI